MKNVLVLGGDNRSYGILQTLLKTRSFYISGIFEDGETSSVAQFAASHHLPISPDWEKMLSGNVDVIINCIGETDITQDIQKAIPSQTTWVPFEIAQIFSDIVREIESFNESTRSQHELMFDLTHDGMIAINDKEEIILFNPSAEKMTGLKKAEVLGKNINDSVPSTALPRVLWSAKPEVNQGQVLENGRKIITNRIPMLDHDGKTKGAFAVFRDITDIENMAEEVTNLKSIQTMLQAIIQSSEEAISVVNEQGKGMMINPAYTRITGLSEQDVIGKPATADISEGESMHMQVLKTRKPVRGARMKVGPSNRDVIVNVAPIIVNGRLKGSVGVIHDMSEITSLTQELDRARQIIRTLEAKYSFADIIGIAEGTRLVIEQAKLAASTPISILLRGESGTGKELFAHAIHNESSRKYRKFVRVNCAAISESQLESEMFGYSDDAFSDTKRRGEQGSFEEANGGSIFLDEIGELSMQMQAKLLRVLQEKEMIRVGGTAPVHVDVRLITATNANLEKKIAEGTFREDLYYRLNRMPIFTPPLRHRKEDIEALCIHFIQRINQTYGRNIEQITDAAIKKLKDYDWPGNVRELENVLGRSMIHMSINEKVIDSQHIPALESSHRIAYRHQSIVLGDDQDKDLAQTIPSLNKQLDNYEKQIIEETLHAFGRNKTKTAEVLGISVRNLYYKMEKHQIEKDDLR